MPSVSSSKAITATTHSKESKGSKFDTDIFISVNLLTLGVLLFSILGAVYIQKEAFDKELQKKVISSFKKNPKIKEKRKLKSALHV